MVEPKARREVVDHLRSGFGLSVNRACSLASISRASYRYKPKPRNDAALTARMRELAAQRSRNGCPMLHAILRREGLVINHKCTERIYAEQRLQLRRKTRKKLKSVVRVPLPVPERPGEVWAMDFMSHSLWGGRRFRILNVLDIYPREHLDAVVDTSLGGERVTRELDRLIAIYGKPTGIVVDNGPEFRSLVMDEWAWRHGIKLDFIDPGKPQQNGFIESFNGTFRAECLDLHWFRSINEARRIVEAWRQDYNHVRPHSALDYLTPAAFRSAQSSRMAMG